MPLNTWPGAGLHLIAESARMGLRELDRLQTAAEKGREALAGNDRRSRLPDTVEALLRAPVVTPKALAAKLRIAPQTATALLRVLQEQGVVREVTGRGRFRAFAIWAGLAAAEVHTGQIPPSARHDLGASRRARQPDV